ncbi:MAG: type VI secretion system protein, partial [Oceanicoccus sp.]
APASNPIAGQLFVLGDGESIGRASGNDVILPDEQRVISSRHVQVSLHGAQFMLLDQSSNGTFINSDPEAIGKGNTLPINSGDLLIIGDYEFSVAIDASSGSASALPDGLEAVDFLDIPGDETSPYPEPPELQSTESTQPHEDNGIADDFDQWIEPSGNPQQVDPWGNIGSSSAVDPLVSLEKKTSMDPLAAFEQPGLGANVLSDEEDNWWEESQVGPANSAAMPEIRVAPAVVPATPPIMPPPVAPPIMPPSVAPPIMAPPVAPSVSLPAPPAAPSAEQSAGLASLLGLHGLSAEQEAALLPNSAAIINSTVENLVNLLQARASIKNELRASRTVITTTGNNPLKFSAGANDALQAMFVSRSDAFVNPGKAVQEGFEDVADHQIAVLYAMKSAFNYMLSQFRPSTLESRLGSDRKGVLGSRKAKIWESYVAHFDELQKDQEASYDRLFGDAFAEAYEEKLQELKSSRRLNRQ